MSLTTISPAEPLSAPHVAALIANPPFPCFFSATVQGFDENGEQFESNVCLDGHLNGDLYLRLSRAVERWSPLFIVLRLDPKLDVSLPALRIALHGAVKSTSPLPGGGADVRVSILDFQQL